MWCYCVPIDVADEADVSHIDVNRLLQVSQLREGINDDTEEDVDHDNDNHYMECGIESELHKVPI